MPALGAQFVVLERETGKIVGRWDADAFFAFHTVQAFERGGELVVDLVAYPDASVITQPEQPAQGILRRYRLMPGARRAPFDIMSNVCIELPRGANRVAHGEQSVVYGVSRHIPQEGVASALSGYNQLVRIDLNSGRDRIWTAAGCSPGEPIIVRRPGAKRDDDGVVLSLVWDAAREAAFMLVLDATSFAEIGRAALPQTSMRMETDHIPYTLIQ
jgi:carotenoid cleavage dioxygenase-like enzyme